MKDWVIKIQKHDVTGHYFVPVQAEKKDVAVSWAYAKLESFLGVEVFGGYEVEAVSDEFTYEESKGSNEKFTGRD